MPEFQVEDVEQTLTDEARNAICDLILAWASYEYALSLWTILAFGMNIDCGSIMLGRMDARTKLERLKQLYGHHRKKHVVSKIVMISKHHGEFVEARNTVAHSRCIGMSKSMPNRLLFSTLRREHGKLGNTQIDIYDVGMLTAGTKFSYEAFDLIRAHIKKTWPGWENSTEQTPTHLQ